MLRPIFLLLALLCPVALVWMFGWWSIGVVALLSVGLFVFSSRQARGVEVDQHGPRTGYRTTSFADF